MFSELIDRAVHMTGRPDSVDDIAYWANVTMRDISKREDFTDDSREAEIVLPPNRLMDGPPIIWDPPEGRQRFRREDVIEDGCGCIADAVKPGSRMAKAGLFSYYHSGGSLVFMHACSPIRIYYYVYAPWLKYYPVASRPAVFDVEANDWGAATEANIALVSNWLLERHSEVVLAGTLAKFFASKQDPRQQVHYSAYEQGISHIIRGESVLELLARK